MMTDLPGGAFPGRPALWAVHVSMKGFASGMTGVLEGVLSSPAPMEGRPFPCDDALCSSSFD